MATDKLVDFDHVTDYISREGAIQFFNAWVDDLNKQIDDSVAYPHLRSDYKVCKTQLEDCIRAILAFPAADVRPVVRGEWLVPDDDYGYLMCSVCEERSPNDERWNFCPNCGADMREDGTK